MLLVENIVNEILRDYDKDNDEIINLEEFIEYYKFQSEYKPEKVWNNLRAFFYKNDLTHESDQPSYE